MRISFALIRHDRFLLFLLYAVIATGFLASTSSDFLHPWNADYVNHVVSIVQAKMAFAEGQFPLRIAPFEYSGWRYPLFQFYSPSVYMFAGLVFQWLFPLNPMAAYQLTLWIFLILGAVYMNRLAYWLVRSRPAALLASIAYLASPYYLIVINHTNGFCEAIALGLVPATLYYTVQRYSHPEEGRKLLQVALAWYLLATTHIVTFMYTSLFAAVLLLLITLKKDRHWRNLIGVGIAYAFGCILAMWYIAPIILLEKYLYASEGFGTNTFSHYSVSLAKLLTPSNNILSMVADPRTRVIQSTIQCQPSIGIPILIAAGVCFYVFFSRSKLENKRADDWLSSLFIIFIISIAMTWSPINVWPWLPHFLTVGQYPWRVMGQSIWIGSLLFAWAVCWLFKNKIDERHVLLGIFLILMSAETWLPTPEAEFISSDPSIFIKNPAITFGGESYLMNYQKSMRFVRTVNDVSLDFINQDKGGLKLNFLYTIRHSLFSRAAEPYIFLDGNILADSAISGQRISILLNGAVVATEDVKAGPYTWKIPMSSIKNTLQNNSDQSLEFKNATLKDKEVYLPANKVGLGGFLKASETLYIRQTSPSCHQQKDMTVCAISASPTTKLIELPIFYYPDLMRVTINDRPVPYIGVLTQRRIAIGVTPLPGVLNTIKIKFRGLQWANSSSVLAWSLWFLFLLFLAMRSVIDKLRQATEKKSYSLR